MVEQTPTAAEAIDPDTEKERIFRLLRQEAAKEEAAAKAVLGEGEKRVLLELSARTRSQRRPKQEAASMRMVPNQRYSG